VITPTANRFAEHILLGYKLALENNFLPFNRNLVFMENSISSLVALQMLMNNSTTLNFNALLVADELEAQRVITQLKAFNKSVPKDIMVFSLAGSLNLPGVPAIPAIEYPVEVMAARIVKWLTQEPQSTPVPQLMRGDLVVP
jgi:DNA-binding LacI/PurR family transcriptional regulator